MNFAFFTENLVLPSQINLLVHDPSTCEISEPCLRYRQHMNKNCLLLLSSFTIAIVNIVAKDNLEKFAYENVILHVFLFLFCFCGVGIQSGHTSHILGKGFIIDTPLILRYS